LRAGKPEDLPTDVHLVVMVKPQTGDIDFKIMFLDCVISRRGIAIQLPPSSLAKNIILKSMGCTGLGHFFG
jgi:hypothetical protein